MTEPFKSIDQSEIHSTQPLRITGNALFRGDTKVEITHRGAIYQLRITRQGKLILTK